MYNFFMFKNNIAKFTLILLILSFCSSNDSTTEDTSQVNNVTSEQSTTTILDEEKTPESTTTTSTTTTTTILDGCIPEDNTQINFNDNSKVQNFLNRYGFNAGDEDGQIGNQTREAIKDFQAYVGITVDGDLGPNTFEKMRNYTGCEERINSYTAAPQTTTTTVPETTATTTLQTTTTTIPETTTTTVISASNGFGHQGFISPDTNSFSTILTSDNLTNNFCSNPAPTRTENNLNRDLGLSSVYSLYPSAPVLASGVTTTITSNNSSSFTIEVNGNGDKDYKFYFIEPYTASYLNLSPTSISTSSGKTTAVFSKENLTNGYWFYGYADSGRGSIVRAEGLREFLVGSEVSQTDNDINSFDDVWIHNSSGLVANSSFVANNTENYITYLMDTSYNSFTTLQNSVDSTSNTIKAVNGDNYSVGDIIVLDNEILKITEKSGAIFTVERGFRNSLVQNHGQGTSIKKLVTSTDMRAVRGYAVFKGEKGYTFSVSLSAEGVPSKFTISDTCPKDVYKLDYLKVFAWREKGESRVKSLDITSGNSILTNDKFTLYQGVSNYVIPDIFASDTVTGEFLNKGPKNETLNVNDEINFDFAGIVAGTKSILFIELDFELQPTGSKATKNRKVVFTPNNGNYIFNATIDSITSTTSYTSGAWEGGYKYQLKSVVINDGVSEVTYFSNGKLQKNTESNLSTHSVYYLDQFSFTIPSS